MSTINVKLDLDAAAGFLRRPDLPADSIVVRSIAAAVNRCTEREKAKADRHDRRWSKAREHAEANGHDLDALLCPGVRYRTVKDDNSNGLHPLVHGLQAYRFQLTADYVVVDEVLGDRVRFWSGVVGVKFTYQDRGPDGTTGPGVIKTGLDARLRGLDLSKGHRETKTQAVDTFIRRVIRMRVVPPVAEEVPEAEPAESSA